MTSRSHAARRSARAVLREFPASPTLPPDLPCDGVAIMLEAGAAAPDLRPLRQAVSGMWRGRLAPEVEIVVARFAHPARVDGLGLRTALPLKALGGALASFARDARDDLSTPHPHLVDHLHEVALWWGGRPVRVSLDALEAIPVAMLWDLPALTVHRPPPPAPVSRTARGAPADGLPAPERTPVGHARGAVFKPGEDALDDVAERLRRLDERTRLASIFKQLTRGGRRREGAEGTQAPEPGVLENLMGWMRWHTPLGSSLRRSLDARMAKVEKMIASRDIDGALKLAIALGGKLGEKARLANRLAGARLSLDFRVRTGGVSVPLFGPTMQSLRARYTALAEQLEKEDDHRRAAFIWAQLLDDPLRAVKALEAGGLFREGAKLAIDSRLEPKIPIRLLFKAGDLAGALTLARRTACFEQLAEDSRGPSGAYHGFVITAWTEMLIQTGQPLRALQVTDQLTQDEAAAKALQAPRQRWLRAALHLCGGDGPDAELAARVLLMTPWSEPNLSALSLDAFPDAPVHEAPEPLAGALEDVQSIVRGETEDAPRRMIGLLGALARLADPERAEQAPFWARAGQPVIETFSLRLLESASDRLRHADLDAMNGLLDKAGLPVLATDLARLRKLLAAKPEKPRPWRVPAATSTRPAVRCACILGNGDLAVWRESGFLELLDRHGRLLWRKGMEDVLALVAVGSGPNLIVVQAEQDGSQRLTRFDSVGRDLHPIGRIELRGCHDITTDGQWMVQIGGDIGALDLAKLCAPHPEIEFLWSCALTERLRALAFSHDEDVPSWVTVDISEGRYGVIELWSLYQTGKLTTFVGLPAAAMLENADDSFIDWYWASARAQQLRRPEPLKTIMPAMPWSEGSERQALAADPAVRNAAAGGRFRIQPCDRKRPYVTALPSAWGAAEPAIARTALFAPITAEPSVVIEHQADALLWCVARGPADRTGSATVLMADEHGRLFIVDSRTAGVVSA